jgi:protein phosphatase
MQYSCGHGTDVGRVRDHNEDNYIALPEKGLWVVADGMGGHAAGEVASAIAVECIASRAGEGMPLQEAIEAAHRAILDAGRQGQGTPGMGCTVVALRLNGIEYEVAWVGDSRAYLIGDALYRLTRDHSFVQQLIDSGAISEADARVHPQRSVITQALGASDLKMVRVDTVKGTLTRGQQILLCSDGLTGEVEDVEMAYLLRNASDSQQAVDRLIQAANTNGGSDNVTVVLVNAPADAPRRKRKGDTIPMQAVVLPPTSSWRQQFLAKFTSIKTLAILGLALVLAGCLLFWFLREEPLPSSGGSAIPLRPHPASGTSVQSESDDAIGLVIQRKQQSDVEVSRDNNLEKQAPELEQAFSPDVDVVPPGGNNRVLEATPLDPPVKNAIPPTVRPPEQVLNGI